MICTEGLIDKKKNSIQILQSHYFHMSILVYIYLFFHLFLYFQSVGQFIVFYHKIFCLILMIWLSKILILLIFQYVLFPTKI